MTDEELIARLRGWARDIQAGSKAIWAMDQDLKEAADRIEALVRKLAWTEAKLEAEELTSGLKLNEANARAERLEAALREIESISVHSGGDVHGVTADHWKMAFEQAQNIALAARILATLDLTPVPRRYMGQIMAECDCPREAECQAAGRCIAEGRR